MANRFDRAKAYTEKYRKVLLPCRFCHNTNIRVGSDRTMTPGNTRDVWFVACSTPKCDCTRSYTSVKDAVAGWNELATTPLPEFLAKSMNNNLTHKTVEQECSVCGHRFSLQYHSNGTYTYLDEPCECEADFFPLGPSLSEWLAEQR